MTTQRRVKRPGGLVSVPPVTPLSPGDQIEYCLTTEVKHGRKGNWWVKIGSTTTVRQGETSDAAFERLQEFVVTALDDNIKEILT